jgi:hypothetical protein
VSKADLAEQSAMGLVFNGKELRESRRADRTFRVSVFHGRDFDDNVEAMTGFKVPK